MIEKGNFESEELHEYIKNKLLPYKDRDVSGIVIGCTHYSFISELIRRTAKEVFNKDVELFDGLYGTVKQVKRVLESKDLLNDQKQKGSIELLSSGTEKNIEIMKHILNI